MGDSGGAGGNAGDCAAGGLYLMDAVKELSVDGLDDKGLAVWIGGVAKVIVLALSHFRKQPLLSQVIGS
jgi:hypothetical protein